MIDLLIKYAHDHGLESEAGFKAKDVRWAVVFAEDGRFLNVIELGDLASKRNRGQHFSKCPDLSQPEMIAGGETRSQFLVDSTETVAPFGDNRNAAKTQRRHVFFVDLLRRASAVAPGLAVPAKALADEAVLARIANELEEKGAKLTDKATLRVGTRFPVEDEAWHNWWREFREGLAKAPAGKRAKRSADTDTMRSLVSGDLVVPVRTHPKISGRGPGNLLVSFDKDAFGSYGLKQSANAAMSEAEATAYRAALEDLLDRHCHNLAGAEIVHWFKENVKPEDDVLNFLVQSEEHEERAAQTRAAELLEAIRTGRRPDLAGNRYYALALSRIRARIMVRDWMEGAFEDLVQSVKAWFSHLGIARLGSPGLAADPPMERVVTSLLLPLKPRQKYEDWIKPIGADRIHLWCAALRPRLPIPYSALARLVRVNAVFHQTGKLEEARKRRRGKESAATLALLYTRMGLVKAYHIRKGDRHMSPGLNENHPDPAYHCGRIMAVLAKLQRAALGDVGAGVVQRYYAAASSTPALVLGRLIRTSQFHLSALGKEKRGLAIWFENQIKSICARVDDGFPAVLDLERQSLFALGYYHQLAYRAPEEPSDTQLTEEENHD